MMLCVCYDSGLKVVDFFSKQITFKIIAWGHGRAWKIRFFLLISFKPNPFEQGSIQADDSQEMSSLIFSRKKKNQNAVCCNLKVIGFLNQ